MRFRFFADKMSACALEKEEERCSWRIFSLRFQAFLARSMATPRSPPARAPSAFASVDSVSARSAPTPFARRPRFALESTIARARSR